MPTPTEKPPLTIEMDAARALRVLDYAPLETLTQDWYTLYLVLAVTRKLRRHAKTLELSLKDKAKNGLPL